MTDDKWQKVKDIFDVALQLKTEQRQKYIELACLEDKAVRVEVETLLASYKKDFIETPAVAAVADVIVGADENNQLSSGELISHYKIIKPIGVGGMGEVYLAEDIKLNRRVALKLLSVELDSDKQHFRRFMREAQTASALNHPNICTIYEINDEGEAPFIAMEYVEGETLGKKIKRRGLDLQEIFKIAIQIASALVAAHTAKVVHRDVKPENIMVRPDGLVKVLDFGLAKLTEKIPEEQDLDSKVQTMPNIQTHPGLVLGTVNYMSPEQARGKKVDTRTDIFSFGVLLYQMLAGKLPFKGENDFDTIASILRNEPLPLSQSLPNVPQELEFLVSKTLRKDREERYQTVRELLADLKDLSQELDLKAITDNREIHVTDSELVERTDNELTRRFTTAGHSGFSPSTVSEMIFSEFKVHPKGSVFALAAIVVLLSAAGVSLYKLTWVSQGSEVFQSMRLAKLTSTGNVLNEATAVSPDGKYVVYAVQEAGRQGLLVKQVATSSFVQIVLPAEVEFSGLTFSPDGNYIYYAVIEGKGMTVIYRVPTLGGNARKLLTNADGPVTFSPDSQRLAFVRNETLLMVANADGSAAQTLAAASEGNRWVIPAWSPDGKIIVSAVYSSVDSNYHLIEVAANDGTEKPFASPPWLWISGLVWLSDGSGLILSGRDLETQLSQLWLISYPDGGLRRITNDLSSYQGVSLTADGKTAVSVQQNRLSNIWVAPETDASFARKITSEVGKDEGMSGVAWTSDGRIVYTARVTGTQDLWIVNQDGSDNRQLTFNVKANFSPAASPDGRYIVFVSDRTGNIELWRMDPDGGNPVQLTDSSGIEAEPSFSPDGKWLVYLVLDSNNKPTIWKIDIDGDNQRQLTDMDSGRPTVSPDGRHIACDYGVTQPGASIKLAVIPFDGGPPTKLLDLPLVLKSPFRWASDGQALIYIDSRDRIYNLWSQPLDGSPPKRLTDFKSDRIFRFDPSRDGRGFALARGDESSDVVLISNFR
jgi:eukaryotic-like serine/threonine-protein kinase